MRALEAGRQRLRARVCVEGILTHLSQGWVIVHVLARSEERAVQVMVPVRGHGVVSTAPGTQQAQSIRIGWTGLPLKVEQHGDATFYGGAYRYMHRAGNHIGRSPTFSAGSSPVRTGSKAIQEIVRGGREEEHVEATGAEHRERGHLPDTPSWYKRSDKGLQFFESESLSNPKAFDGNKCVQQNPPTHPPIQGWDIFDF